MLKLMWWKILIVAVAFGNLVKTTHVEETIESTQIDEHSDIPLTSDTHHQKPTLEVFMHLPPGFDHVRSFITYFRSLTERKDAGIETNDSNGKDRKSERVELLRRKRETEKAEKTEPETAKMIAEPDQSVPVQSALSSDLSNPLAAPLMDMQEEIRRSLYSPFEVNGRGENVPQVNDNEDRIQRDKRTFMENGGGGERETTTAMPYWKRKKENPPFVTGRDGSNQKVSNYPPAQHRSVDSVRESHSIKDLDKTVLSNEITRTNQDNYYASTNRRTYNSRQAESYTPRTPKSVYDTIDYSNRRRNQESRFSRNFDSKRQIPGKEPEQLARQYSYPRPYERPYYPFQGDVIGRGIEYYHRTFDPVTGRIIYYANMPDPARNFDPNVNYGDPSGRSIYVNGRTYFHDPYGRSFMYPNDYRISGGRNPPDYLRTGRSYPDFYYPGSEKTNRNIRYNGLYDKDRSKDDFRNRTYVIFDAEESAIQDRRVLPFVPPDFNRFPYPAPPPYAFNYRPTAIPGPPPMYPDYPFRNQFFPTVQTPVPWNSSPKPYSTPPSNFVTRPFNNPEVQLPLTTQHRSLYPLPDYQKMKKS